LSTLHNFLELIPWPEGGFLNRQTTGIPLSLSTEELSLYIRATMAASRRHEGLWVKLLPLYVNSRT